MTSNGTANGTTPKITLYTNHGCPWAHRAHIVLKELNLPYEEVIIDLSTPREPWYLEINPRGLVPTIKYSNGDVVDEIITESGIVSQFLAEAHPSYLLSTGGSPSDALKRARINFFVDTWVSKANSNKIMLADSAEEKEKLSQEFVEIVRKEIEPLLKDAAPFFGGSSKFTMAEVLTASFVLRIYAFAKHDVLPKKLIQDLDTLPNFSKWAHEIIKQESVTYIWNEDKIIPAMKKKIASMKKAK